MLVVLPIPRVSGSATTDRITGALFVERSSESPPILPHPATQIRDIREKPRRKVLIEFSDFIHLKGMISPDSSVEFSNWQLAIIITNNVGYYNPILE